MESVNNYVCIPAAFVNFPCRHASWLIARGNTLDFGDDIMTADLIRMKKTQFILTITKTCQVTQLTSSRFQGHAADFIAREYRNLRRHIKGTLALLPIVMLLGTGCGNSEADIPDTSNPVQTISPVTIQTGSGQGTQDSTGSDSLGTQGGTGSDSLGTQGGTESGAGLEPSAEPTPAPTPAPTPDPGPEPETIFESDSWWLSYGDSGTQPRGNAAPADLAWYGAYYVGSSSEKVVYLTFDCGYENGNTELILDALKNHNAKGTFFVVGHFLETEPDLLKRMVDEGHAVGNHTYHHPDMSAITDAAAFQKELDDVADLFHEITGAEISKFYRPPEGKCTKENLRITKSLGYHTIFWSLAHVDWMQDKQPDPQEAIDTLSSRVHPGAIVLLHNTSNTNGKIIDDLLTKWEEMGYSFRPLSDLTDPTDSPAP